MSIDVIDGQPSTQPMGRLLQLPGNTLAGDAASLRAELVARLRERRPAIVDEMAEAVQRAGLAEVLQVGEVGVAERLDLAVGIMLAAWEHHRPLHGAELDALGDLGADVAGSGVPVWHLLEAVHHASRAGWSYALEHALALVDTGHRPATAAQLVADLSVQLFDVVGRIEAQLAAGYAWGRRRPPEGQRRVIGRSTGPVSGRPH